MNDRGVSTNDGEYSFVGEWEIDCASCKVPKFKYGRKYDRLPEVHATEAREDLHALKLINEFCQSMISNWKG